MCYNYVPSFCDSLERHETIVIFGVPFLRLVFGLVKHDIEDKFINESKEKLPSEKKQIFCTYLPRLLNALEKELNDATSTIWNQSSHLGNSMPIYEAEIYSNTIILYDIIYDKDR
jgi:hypothetical protein